MIGLDTVKGDITFRCDTIDEVVQLMTKALDFGSDIKVHFEPDSGTFGDYFEVNIQGDYFSIKDLRHLMGE